MIVPLMLFLSLYILLPCFNLYKALKSRPSRAQMMVVLFITVTLLHNAGFFLEMTAPGVGEIFTAAQIEFLFGNLSLYTYAYFVFAWCKVKLPKGLHASFFLINLALFFAALTSGHHELYYAVDGIRRSGTALNYTIPILRYGPIEYAVFFYYAAVYVFLGAVIAKAYRRTNNKKGRHTLLLFALAGWLPMLSEILYTTGVITFIDPMPTGYFISQCLLTWCIARDKVFDTLQNAFELIAKRLDGALIVVDGEENLLYVNDAASDLLPRIRPGEALPPDVARLFREDAPGEELRLDGRVYQSRMTVLGEGAQARGKVLLLSDVSHIYKIQALLEEENRRITADLELAATIQINALPRVFPPWPERGDFDIYATMRPAKEVGGDFYDFFLTDETHLGCVIADVSGKGVPAALFMMNAKACIRDRMMAGMPPDAAFNAANDQLCEGNAAELFVTAWAILIDLRTGEARFANAGHNPPYKRDAKGAWSRVMSRPDLVLADTPGYEYRLNALTFEPGDELFLYTDGVTEAQDGGDRLYGGERLLGVLTARGALPPDQLLPAVQADVDAFVGGAPQFDDMTMLAVRIDDLRRAFTVPAALEQVEPVQALLADWLSGRACGPKARRAMKLSLEEMFSNIARYAYAGVPGGGEATVEFFAQGRDAVIRLTDAGTPFNPLDVTREKRVYEDAWDEGGSGIGLVKHLMDDLAYEYRDGQNRFTMKKAMDAE